MRNYRATDRGREATRKVNTNWVSRNRRSSTEAVRRFRAANPDSAKQYYENAKRCPERLLWHAAKSRAKKSDVPFDILHTDFEIPEFCPLLGVVLQYGHADNAPSLDRIHPNLGYIRGNVMVVSRKANRMKNNATADELLRLALALKDITDV